MPNKSLPSGHAPTEDDDSERAKRKSIQAVEVGVGLLKVFVEADSPLPLKEIAALAGLSRSQAHRYLLSFVNTGMVRQDPECGHYELGPLSIATGLAALRMLEPVQIGGEALVHLTSRSGVTGQLLVWGKFGPTIIRIRPGKRFLPVPLQVGSVVPILHSSAGLVFTAYLPEQIASDAVREEWTLANRTPANGWKTFLRQCRQNVRAAGFGASDGTMVPGLSAISAPIFDSQGSVALVLALGSHDHDKISENQELIDALKRETRIASERLGYTPLADLESN